MRGGEQGGKSSFSLLSEPISPSSLLFEPISLSSLNGYVSFSPPSLLFPPISPSSQLFLGHFSLLPILFLPPHKSNIKIFDRLLESWVWDACGDCWEKYPAGVSERPSKAIKVYGLEILKTYKLCWRTLWTSLPTSTSLVFTRLSSVFPNELVLISLAPCHSVNQGCKLFLKRFHKICQQNKTLFDTVSTGFDVPGTCWLFIKKSLMRPESWQLQRQWNWT